MSRSSTRIGITIFTSRTGAISWFSNGAHQNIAFLRMCLRSGGFDVVMLNGGDGEAPPAESLPQELRDLTFVPISDEVVDTLDVLIQAGAQVSADHVDRVHARGGKAIAFKFGSEYPIDAERAIHNRPVSAIFNGARFDEIWTTAQHTEHNRAYWEITYRCQVRVLPHIWHPAFVNQIANLLSLSGRHVGYVPGHAKKRIVILEPNINLVKTCHIPILIAEAAYRSDPDLFERVCVLNAENIRKHQTFTSFVNNLDLSKAIAADGFPMISFESRFSTPYFMGTQGDVAISHQWIPSANYCHYDLLHLGYPLIHNVPEMHLAGVGYYYPEFDAQAGAAALLRCLAVHDKAREIGDQYARHFLETRIATSRANVTAHAQAIRAVLS